MKAAFSQLQLPIRSVKCLGAIPIKGAGDKPFILYRMQVHVMQDKGGTPEMKRGWVVARKFALFNNLRLALKAVPTQGLKTTAPFPKDGRKFRKGGTETKAAVMERCPLLEAWLNETLSLFRNQPMVTEFLKNDGSDVRTRATTPFHLIPLDSKECFSEVACDCRSTRQTLRPHGRCSLRPVMLASRRTPWSLGDASWSDC